MTASGKESKQLPPLVTTRLSENANISFALHEFFLDSKETMRNCTVEIKASCCTCIKVKYGETESHKKFTVGRTFTFLLYTALEGAV